MTLATLLQERRLGTPDLLTIFTPGSIIAEDAGLHNSQTFLDVAQKMGIHYKNDVIDVKRLTSKSIEFESGDSIDAELKIIIPDWRAHDFLRGLPISDDEGFVVTDLLMRNPTYRNVFAAGDCAATTVPKIGGIGHQQADIAARQIALDLGRMTKEDSFQPLKPEIFCIGDMGRGKAFYIRSNAWYGGDVETIQFGAMPYQLKMRYRDLFFLQHGRVPDVGMRLAQLLAEHVHI